MAVGKNEPLYTADSSTHGYIYCENQYGRSFKKSRNRTIIQIALPLFNYTQRHLYHTEIVAIHVHRSSIHNN